MPHLGSPFGGFALRENGLWLSDNATGDVSITRHGFVPKAPSDASKYLDGTGAWSTPPGTGAGYTFYDPDKSQASPTSLDDDFTGAGMGSYTGVNTGSVISFDVNTTKPRALWVDWPAASGSNTIRAWLATLPAGDCTVQMRIRGGYNSTGAVAYLGICLSDGTTAGAGKQWIPSLTVAGSNEWRVYGQSWTNFSAFAADRIGNYLWFSADIILRLSRSGTTWTVSWSADGRTWAYAQSTVTEATLGFTPVNVGPYVLNSSAQRLQGSFGPMRYAASAAATFGGTRTI